MQCSVALLVIAVVVCGGKCRMPSKQIFNELFRRVDFKRQASDVDQCVNDRLEAASADEVCMIGVDELNTASDNQQATNEIYEAFCRPNCKNLVLRVTDECDIFRDFPGLREFYSGVCDTNMNGQPCYSFSTRAVNFILGTEIDCFDDDDLNNTCNCRSELMAEVETQGCCINVYQNFFEAVFRNSSNFSYDPKEIYEGCSVDQPEECSSMALMSTLAIITTSFILHTMITY